MSITVTQGRAIVSCVQCDCILAAEIGPDGSYILLGTEDECVCGGHTFRRLR